MPSRDRWQSPAFSLAVIVAGTLASTSSVRAEGGPTAIIAPGQEKLLGEMLGDGKPVFPDECKLDEASIQKSVVAVSFACKTLAKASVELRHHDAGGAGAVLTHQFALVNSPTDPAPAPLMSALAKRIKDREKAWKWSFSTNEGQAGPDNPDAGPHSAGRSAEENAMFARGLELYREGKYEDAFQQYLTLARKNTHTGILGMLVATLASTHPTKQRIEQLMAEADAKPDDVLLQFVAGVGAHYYAHQSAATTDAKKDYYQRALMYLSKANPAYDYEPRLFIYLAVSNFRLGHQKEAEQLVEKAVSLGNDDDPDAYYCRAEIFQRTNVKRSLADLDVYFDMQMKQKAEGAVVSEVKLQRVRKMQEYLLKVSRGELQPTELFDPIEESAKPQIGPPDPPDKNAGKPRGDTATATGHEPAKTLGARAAPWLGGGAAVLAAFVLAMVARRRKRQSAGG